jgi:hypothetical protein
VEHLNDWEKGDNSWNKFRKKSNKGNSSKLTTRLGKRSVFDRGSRSLRSGSPCACCSIDAVPETLTMATIDVLACALWWFVLCLKLAEVEIGFGGCKDNDSKPD